MKVLRIVGGVILAAALLAGVAWLLRSDPVGPVAGRAVSGDEVPYPADWAFTDAHFTIAVETRPDDPHSVTTICFVHDGVLFVPAQGGSEKSWTSYVLEDPRVRLKIGDDVYPARAIRVTDADREAYLAAAAKKYEQMADGREPPEDVWLFRIEPRQTSG